MVSVLVDRRNLVFTLSLAFLLICCIPRGYAQLPDAPQPQTAVPASGRVEQLSLAGLPRRILRDQEQIITRPLRFRVEDMKWAVPFAVGTGLLIGSDHHSMTQLVRVNAQARSRSGNISDAGLAAFGVIPAGMYVWSKFRYAPHAHEAALLTGEAMIDGAIENEGLKLIFRRDRPDIGNMEGRFFRSDFANSSFPSDHTMIAWSAAGVLGQEYPGWASRLAIFSLASAVSVSRITAHEHFPSDVLVGSVTGYLIGRYVYSAHHNDAMNIFSGSAEAKPEYDRAPDPLQKRPPTIIEREPDEIGSAYVPMDSWIYPALERLGALGFVVSQDLSIRPWTRQECLRQVDEADARSSGGRDLSSAEAEAGRSIPALRYALMGENADVENVVLESAYGRFGTIAGPALADGFHFGQTWQNDYGRPLTRGTSLIGGFAVRARSGRFSFHAREEYQHAPSQGPLPFGLRALEAQLDSTPVAGGESIGTISRQRPIDLYAGVTFAGYEASFGKQEMYWGPGVTGPLAFSINAEPTYNLQLTATRPHDLPGFLSRFGTFRTELVLGKLSGHQFPERPWFNGQKISFNLGENLQLSFTRWSIFAGVGHPLTLHRFIDNFFSFSSSVANGADDRNDPGDRKSGFDFRYRLPLLRRSVTLYADSYADDDPSPVDAPRRAAISPGIYFARVPGIPHLDLRVEAATTNVLKGDPGGQFNYFNSQYRNGNTNKGFLLGNAVGRDGRSIEARSTYWFSPRTKVEGRYRQEKIGRAFLAGGGTQTDVSVSNEVALGTQWSIALFAQRERYAIPVLGSPQQNTSGWLRVTYEPHLHFGRP